MRIGINLLFLIPDKVGGTETYTRGLINGLLENDAKNQYILFCNKENYSSFLKFKNCEVVELPFYASNRILRLFYEQFLLPFYLKKHKIDVVYSLGYTAPFFPFCKSIVTIYDLNWYYHPEDFSKIEKLAWQFFVSNSARFGDKIITTSKSSKESLIKVLDIESSKISVIYGGVPELAKPGKKEILKKLGINNKYLFTVVAAYPHKNLMTLLKAFKEISIKKPNLQLVVVGLGGRAEEDIKKFISENNLSKRVHILGWVNNTILSTLYKFAEVFIFPSKYEGFGFPIVEALYFKKPIVSSNAFSLKEVVGDAGILVNPINVDELSKSICKVLDNSHIKNKLLKASGKKIRNFLWSDAAEQTINIFKSL